jgi:hypothetical protein
MKIKGKGGFSYWVDSRHMELYRKWPLEMRLQWLLLGNKLRKCLPERTKKLHDAFRKGKI